MTSWRDSTSPAAQDDLDGLLDTGLKAAEDFLARRGQFHPFAVAVSLDGQDRFLASAGSSDRPHATDLLDDLLAGVRSDADATRATAFVADVLANRTDCVRLELEHREGTALVILVPYKRSRLRKSVALGGMTVSAGVRRIWPDA